jgi:hypothetical protein
MLVRLERTPGRPGILSGHALDGRQLFLIFATPEMLALMGERSSVLVEIVVRPDRVWRIVRLLADIEPPQS